MATKTFTQLTAVTALAAGDELVQWNASAVAARKVTVANFIANSPNGGLAEKGAANTFTAKQIVAGVSPVITADFTSTGGYLYMLMSRSGVSKWYLYSDDSSDKLDIRTASALGGISLAINGDVSPMVDNYADCGTASFRWNDVYATNATIQTSDEREKTDIVDTDIGLAFIRGLRPVQYCWRDVEELTETRTVRRPVTQAVERSRLVVEQDDSGRWVQREIVETVQDQIVDQVPLYDAGGKRIGTHDVPRVEDVEETVVVRSAKRHTRPHYGLIAQQVKELMDDMGINDFAGYIYDPETDRHGLRYGELWGPMIRAIQEGAGIIEELQAEVAALVDRVAVLEGV